MTEPAAPTRTEPVLDSVTRADPSDELATTTLLRAAIGPVNTDYYLAIFTRFDAQDKTGPSWNTAAALSTLNWMLFRRMWNAALAYCGIALTVALLVFGIGKLALHYSNEVQWGLAGLYALVLVAVPGLFGNALLFKQYRRDMARALSSHPTLPDATTMLAAHAPSRQRLAVLTGLNLVVAATVAAVVQWAANFNGLPTSLGTAPTPAAPATTPVPGSNVAMGRAVEASTAVQAAVAVSAAQASAPTPSPVASAVQVAASAPAATASSTTAQAASYAGRGQVQPALASPPALTPQSSAPRPPAQPALPATTAPRQSPAMAAARVGTSTTPPALNHFIINVGLFADDNNARNALVKLKDAGLAAYTQEMRGKKGKLTWVRVGPFDTLAQAEKTVDTIRTLGLEAQAVKQPQ